MLEPLLPRLKREMEARLAELRPVVAEYRSLEAAKTALLEDMQPKRPRLSAPVGPRVLPPREALRATSSFAEPERPRRNGTATNGNGAEANSESEHTTQRDTILALVEERPGVSVAEIVSVTKFAKPTVATTVSKLKREGVLADEAGGVKLASRQPVTLAQAADAGRDAGVSDAEWEAARPASAKDAAA